MIAWLNLGVAVEVGDGVTQVVPVVEGYPMLHAASRMDVAGGLIFFFIHSRLLYLKYILLPTLAFEIRIRVRGCLLFYEIDGTG